MDENKMTVEDAQKLLEMEHARNVEAASQEIDAVLQKYGLHLAVAPQLNVGPDGTVRATAHVQLVKAQR